MSSIAWYRKYRPYTMEDYMGEGIRHIVENRFTVEKNMPNVTMVHGSRGCGKTTFARIVSKYYLCEDKIEGTPCEKCEICRTINEVLIEGETGVEVPGVVELDATIMNGKDAIQQIIEDAILPPMYTKRKVLIIDECHMITNSGQNSLLKVIEDIPEHLIVIFATTDPEKVLGTIHSRCQLKIEVRKKSVDELADRLLYISKREGLTTSIEALKVIAKKADRVPREAINLLESIAKSYGNVVTIENVRKSTGDVAAEIYMEYFEAANDSLELILQFNKKLKELDIDAKDFISGLTRFALDSMYIRHGISLEDYPIEYVREVKKLFKMYESSHFDTLLQVLEYASKMIRTDDEARNELIITTTALRIGKIDFLSKGLDDIKTKAEKENKISIREHQKKIKKEQEEQFQKINTFSPTKEKLASLFGNAVDIKGIEESEIKVKGEGKDDEGQDGFFSPDALNDMIQGGM